MFLVDASAGRSPHAAASDGSPCPVLLAGHRCPAVFGSILSVSEVVLLRQVRGGALRRTAVKAAKNESENFVKWFAEIRQKATNGMIYACINH
ncbi:hypothetical protein [Geopseudomonas sagittaria]|uniref:hypothetical protein n=1 Tax=Geopseudomonas sagittaria TaxID=1135990 RepID=UPI0011141846|nr:hypothetical protein [Pseudomonas sagittaria]